MCKAKAAGASNIRVKTDNGRILTSYKSAAKFVQSYDKYTADDVQKLYHFPKGERLNYGDKFRKREDVDWSTSAYLPRGWMGKKTGFKKGRKTGIATKFITGAGEKLTTYNAAALFMKSSGKIF